MIDNSTVNKVIDTAEIIEVVGDFVSLKRRGANYIACCPFHNEKTPSFSVSPSKGIYKCFGCGKAGNVVGFVMEHEQMTFVEAIKYLGKKYGIEVKEKEETAEDVAEKQRRESLLVVSEFAQQYFSDTLHNTPVGQAVGLSYFKEARGFSDETIQKFSLGFAPDHNSIMSLADSAVKAGYKKEFLIATGLCIERDGGKLIDRFYDRVMFPIHSLSGRVIAFGGRTLRTDKKIAKYINSPETEIYNKSESLYGIFQAKASISKEQQCYLVEGYSDVISLSQAGIENVVASSGTSLTPRQVRLIRRFTTKVTVLYDGDAAGIKASLRGIDILIEEGMEVKVVLFPDGDDPDSFVRKYKVEEVKDYLQENENDFISFKYQLLSEDIARDPIRKASLIKEIIRTISLIPDQIVRSVYIEECAAKLEVKQELLISEVSKIRRERIASGESEKKRQEERQARRAEYEQQYPLVQEAQTSSSQTSTSQEQRAPIMIPSEEELLYYLLRYGEKIMHFEEHQQYGSDQPIMNITVSEYISAELDNDELSFQNSILKEIYDLYFVFRQETKDQDKLCQMFINYNKPHITNIVLNLILDKHTINIKEFQKSLIPEENVLGVSVPKSVLVFKYKYTEYTYQTVQLALQTAQKEKDIDAQTQLMNQLRILMQVRNTFSKELNRLT